MQHTRHTPQNLEPSVSCFSTCCAALPFLECREWFPELSESCQTANYNAEDLIGRQIVSAMNLGTKKIGDFKSEVLVLGHNDKNGNVILLEPDKEIKNGALVN